MTAKKKQQKKSKPPLSPTPQDLGLAPGLYAEALAFLFDRDVEGRTKTRDAWYWQYDLQEPALSALDWVNVQVVLYANAGRDLAGYTDQQVGMGLEYLSNNAISQVSHAVDDPSVPVELEASMLAAMPLLWADCIGPRLQRLDDQGLPEAAPRLRHACYMWFDVWPSFWTHRELTAWREGMQALYETLLQSPYAACQECALHGIGHDIHRLDGRRLASVVRRFVETTAGANPALAAYAEQAAKGMVQ